MPKVSVIMPIYNKESRIKSSIESVLNQTYSEFELILINDGSTDASGEIAIEYYNKDPRIRYYSQSNQGVSRTRNYGIDIAKGEYISFIDSDDEWDKFFLERMLSEIDDSNVCYCGHYFFINGRKSSARINFIEGDILEEYLFNKCTPNTNSWLIKKSFLNEYNIRFSPNIDWGEDMIFFSKVIMHEKNIKCVKEYLSEYHFSEANSLSENNLDKIQKDINWMSEISTYINRYETDLNRKAIAIKAIRSYRLPGAIIYRLYSNLNIVDGHIIKRKLKELQEYLKEMNFSNGLRSIKLYYIYLKLRLKLR
ncbi:MAG: glycosyltransferase family 2 protein [Tissierellaceae bacterium]|jgi:glycosyltransferase involved in cell wall biosynthesis